MTECGWGDALMSDHTYSLKKRYDMNACDILQAGAANAVESNMACRKGILQLQTAQPSSAFNMFNILEKKS